MRFKCLFSVIIVYSIAVDECSANKTIEAKDRLEFRRNSKIVGHDHCSNWTNYIESEHGKCSCYNGNSLRCYGVPNFVNESSRVFCHSNASQPKHSGKVWHLIICGWSNDTFDPWILTKFPRLRTIVIEYGALQTIDTEFPHLKHLQHLRIKYTHLTHIRLNMFKHLTSLKSIDLRSNQLDHYNGSTILPKRVQKLFLSGNPYNCSKNFKWLLNHSKAKYIVDRNALQCGDNLFKNHSLQNVMYIKTSLNKMCQSNAELRNCTCILSYITLDLDGTRRPMYSINCSYLNLYRLPASVPENTTTFYAQYNQISDVSPLSNAYRNVHDIHLDYNQISTIESLETDNNWLERFRALSLKGNRLSKLPVYLLNSALERNIQASALYLSENPWRCECNFMLRFQELLQRHRAIIKDVSDIRCINRDEDEIIVYSVLALERSDVCILPTVYIIQPIDMLNGVLATLIIFIILKLSYDCYNYRVYGQLPWIVTKMP